MVKKPNESVEELQQKQCLIQARLNEVLENAKKLSKRQEQKIAANINDKDDNTECQDLTGEDDDELVEFQQIENELRISELTRQLNHIQEELRIKLYKQLLSNTNTEVTRQRSNSQHQYKAEDAPSVEAKTELSNLSFSSCSDSAISTDANTSVSTSTVSPPSSSVVSSAGPVVEQKLLDDQSCKIDKFSTQESLTHRYNDNTKSDSSSKPDYSVGHYDVPPVRTTKKLEDHLNKISSDITEDLKRLDLTIQALTEPQGEIANIYETVTYTKPYVEVSGRTTVNDLERIDEDDEEVCHDNQESYTSEARSRIASTTEFTPTNLSVEPPLNNGIMKNINNASSLSRSSFVTRQFCNSSSTGWNSKNIYPVELNNSANLTSQDNTAFHDQSILTCTNFDKFPPSKAIRCLPSSCSNRPLTLYMPKPDDDIDLVEHVQISGHDLGIISQELKIDSTTAKGYLWKKCSNSNKKWLKRYFCFDRGAKTFCYYENESQSTKKQSNPKNSIHFDAINDVYVDHKLSSLCGGEKSSSQCPAVSTTSSSFSSSSSSSSTSSSTSLSSSSRKRSYIFILSTIGRQYHLATSSAEIMRAWIDLLYTAANAEDYFQYYGN